MRTVEPLRFHGNEVVLFHVLDPQEIRPELGEPSTADRPGNAGAHGSHARLRAQRIPREDGRAHRGAARPRAAAGMDYYLLVTDRPLDDALREYLTHPAGEELMGFLAPWFLAGVAALGLPIYLHLLRRHTTHSASVQLADVFRAAHAKLDQAPAPALSCCCLSLRCAAAYSAGAGVCQSVHQPLGREHDQRQARCCW